MKEKQPKKGVTKKKSKYDVTMKFSGSPDAALKAALNTKLPVKNK